MIYMCKYIFMARLLEVCNLCTISISENMKPAILAWKCNLAARFSSEVHGINKNSCGI